MDPGYKMDPVRNFSAVRDFFRRCAKKKVRERFSFLLVPFCCLPQHHALARAANGLQNNRFRRRDFFFGKVFSGAAFPVNNAEPRRAHRVGEVKIGPNFCFVHNSRHRAIQDLGIEFLDRESRGEQVPSARWPLAIAKKLLSAQP